MNTRVVGLAAAGVGAGLQVVGLVLSLDDAGRPFFIVGLELVVIGLVVAILGHYLYQRGSALEPVFQLARIGVPILIVGVLTASVATASMSSLDDDGHEAHAPANDGHAGGHAMFDAALHDHELIESKAHVVHYMAAAQHAEVAVTEEHDTDTHAALPFPTTGSDHHGAPAGPPEPEDPALLESQLAAARAVALAHPTKASAEAAGYAPVTTYIPKIATHLLALGTVDRNFDAGAPEVLLYAGDFPDSPIVGVAYLTTGFPIAPGFAGNADHWHEHRELCISKESRLIIGVDPNEAACNALGGQFFTGLSLWLLHAWVVPGFESPAGVFSADHPLLP